MFNNFVAGSAQSNQIIGIVILRKSVRGDMMHIVSAFLLFLATTLTLMIVTLPDCGGNHIPAWTAIIVAFGIFPKRVSFPYVIFSSAFLGAKVNSSAISMTLLKNLLTAKLALKIGSIARFRGNKAFFGAIRAASSVFKPSATFQTGTAFYHRLACCRPLAFPRTIFLNFCEVAFDGERLVTEFAFKSRPRFAINRATVGATCKAFRLAWLNIKLSPTDAAGLHKAVSFSGVYDHLFYFHIPIVA